MSTVIVFGPTGNIGSWAARTAQAQGAHVVLAMRDPAKPIPGLTPEQETAGGFVRVPADLTQPDTVAAAVAKTQATRAFLYAAHRTPDHMRATLQALRSAGVAFVVFLSSYSIGTRDPRDVPAEESIPYAHAQVEISLDEVYGPEHYVSLRPGSFATNTLQRKAGILAGTVPLYGAGWDNDLITPMDIGQVGGTLLAKGPQDQHIVYLYGPQRLPLRDVIAEIARTLGRDVQIADITRDEALAQFAQAGTPRPFAEYMVRLMNGELSMPHVCYEEGVQNVQKYTGRPATEFSTWLAENLDRFRA